MATQLPKETILLFSTGLAALIISGIAPHDRLTWWLEIAPILIIVPILCATVRRFPLTALAYRLIFLHALVLMVGGHYTYAETPLGYWLRDLFDLTRNPYDRIGHLMQGFVPAIVAREILLRVTPLQRGKMLFYIVGSICLAFSAFFELLEWWAALVLGADADAFLATQGDVWDSHWDMLCALIGATAAQFLLSRIHDRQLRTIQQS